jgi:hypothetical protein
MWNIAQVNVSRIRGISMEDPIMKTFVEQLDPVNALAEQSPGFVWRLKEDSGNATAIRFDSDNRIIVNMSVWKDIPSLENFAYKSNHREVLAKRKEWFEKMEAFAVGIWYVPVLSFPSVEDARFRLNYLRENGSTPFCFGFKEKYNVEEYVDFLKKI